MSTHCRKSKLGKQQAAGCFATTKQAWSGVQVLPVVIETSDDHERLLGKVDELMARDTELLTEEIKLLKLLGALIQDYEKLKYRIHEGSSPAGMLRHLMEARGLKQADLVPIIGSRGTVSAILSGKRGISKETAKKLGAFFGVSADLFL